MSPDQRFSLLLTLMGLLLGGVGMMIRLLWTVSSKWQRVTDTLQYLGDEIKSLVLEKEKEHDRINSRIDRHEQLFYQDRRNGK